MTEKELPQRPIWRPAAECAPLAGDVHVWRIALDRDDVEVVELERPLSDDERARAARFVFDKDRRRFIAARGSLRVLLSRYTGRRPETIEFCYGPQGKPFLADPSDLRFNLSHSGRFAVFACVRNREIGIDVERERPEVEFEEIAARFFSSPEQAALQALPREQRRQAFFTCWSRKEAYIKALGGGLSVPLDRFDMTLAPGQPAQLIVDRGDSAAAAAWTVYDIRPDEGYAGAAVVAGPGGSLQLWDLPAECCLEPLRDSRTC